MLRLGRVRINLKIVFRNLAVLVGGAFFMYHWVKFLELLLTGGSY